VKQSIYKYLKNRALTGVRLSETKWNKWNSSVTTVRLVI